MMNKHYVSNVIAVISCLGMMALMATHFFGGIFIWMLILWFIFIPLIILYVVSFCGTLICFFNKDRQEHKIKIWAHLLTIGIIILFNIYDLECFRNDRIMSAILYGDLGQDNLILRENGEFEVVSSVIGIKSECKGRYYFKGDTIIFSKIPGDAKEILPNKALYDKQQKAIFTDRDNTGKFIRKKELLNHFSVESIYNP